MISLKIILLKIINKLLKNTLTLSLMMKSHIILFPEILFLSLYLIVYLQAQLLHLVRLFVTPWTVAHQAPLSVEFSRQEYWSRLPFPIPGDLPNSGIKLASPALPVDSLPVCYLGIPYPSSTF